jgi:hypothetical protein
MIDAKWREGEAVVLGFRQIQIIRYRSLFSTWQTGAHYGCAFMRQQGLTQKSAAPCPPLSNPYPAKRMPDCVGFAGFPQQLMDEKPSPDRIPTEDC